MKLPRMTTRQLMVAAAVAAVLSAGLAASIGAYGRREAYLEAMVGRFAAVKDRTGVILETAEAPSRADMMATTGP